MLPPGSTTLTVEAQYPTPAMQLTSHTDYALRLLIYLMSNSTRNVSTREVAEAYRISANHLTKVAKSLTKAGWLVSARGGGGGLMLAPHTATAKVGEIVRYTESNCDIAECFNTSANSCPITHMCDLKPILYRARQAFFDVLDSVAVRDLVRNPEELNLIFSVKSSLSAQN